MAYADLAGLRIFYQDVGAGEVVLLIHGIGASSDDWEEQLPEFSHHYRIIAPDLRGFGRSEQQGPFSIDQFAADLWALLDRLEIGYCHIVGHSMGGAVALQMALEQPDRVNRMVLSGTLPSFQPNSPHKLWLLGYRLVMMALLGPQRLSAAVSRHLFPNPDHEHLRARVARRGSRNSRRVYLGTILNAARWSVAEQLAELPMPTLVMMAEHDYFPMEDAMAFAAAIPGAGFEVLQGLHHSAPMEAPERFNSTVLPFLLAGY